MKRCLIGDPDGTLFYPWDKKRVGGTTPIPIESMRMKLIRNGHQDYEYLRLAGVNNMGVESMSLDFGAFVVLSQRARWSAVG